MKTGREEERKSVEARERRIDVKPPRSYLSQSERDSLLPPLTDTSTHIFTFNFFVFYHFLANL